MVQTPNGRPRYRPLPARGNALERVWHGWAVISGLIRDKKLIYIL